MSRGQASKGEKAEEVTLKVLLINPPQTTYAGAMEVERGLPLGLMYMAAALERGGHRVEILDALVGHFQPRRVGRGTHYGLPWERIRTEVERRQPEVVGIGNPFSTQVENAILTARTVKEVNSTTPVVVGGPHVTVSPAQFLEAAPWVDVVVRGEGEYTMLELVDRLESQRELEDIQGISWRKNGKVRLNPPRAPIVALDKLPYPAYHLVDMESYLNPGKLRYRSTRFKREVSLITSRGCPYNCIFCSIHPLMGAKWRGYSATHVLDHIEHLITQYGVQHIHFEDDNLTLNRKRFDEILEGIVARGLKFLWDTPNGIRAEGLTLERLAKMKQTGCAAIRVGVESGNQGVLEHIVGKRLQLEEVVQAARNCKQARVRMEGFYVIGFPGETKQNMGQTIDFALRLRQEFGVFMHLFIATPLYGSRLYELASSNGYLTQEPTPQALAEATQIHGRGLIETPAFTPEDVKALARQAFRRHTRLSLVEFLKDWRVKLHLAVNNPQTALRYIKGALGL